MIKIKLSDAVNGVEGLNKLVEAKLPIKASYWVSRIIKKLATDIELYNEKRNALLKELGTAGEEIEGKVNYTFEGDNGKKFTEQIMTLLGVEIELDFNKIKIDDIGDATIEPKYLTTIEWLFE